MGKWYYGVFVGAGIFVGFLAVRKVFGLVSIETLLKGFWWLRVFVGVFGS